MLKNAIVAITIMTAFTAVSLKAGISGILDVEKFCREVYDLYQTDEVQVKKEVLVYKKLHDMIGTTQTIKFLPSDSIAYDRKADVSTIKAREIYYADAQTGYFGVIIIVSKKGDDMMMSATPDKEMTQTGIIKDLIVTQYVKNHINSKCYTSLNDFDDKGTIIQQIVLKIEI